MSKMETGEKEKSRVAGRDEVKAVIVQQDDVRDFGDIWPAVKAGILEKKPERKMEASFYRKWIFAAAGMAAVIFAGFFFYTILLKDRTGFRQEGEARFRINSIRVGDEPATPFVYQPKNSDIILVWAEKSM